MYSAYSFFDIHKQLVYNFGELESKMNAFNDNTDLNKIISSLLSNPNNQKYYDLLMGTIDSSTFNSFSYNENLFQCPLITIMCHQNDH